MKKRPPSIAIISRASVEKIAAERAARARTPFALVPAHGELYSNDLLVGQNVRVLQATSRTLVLLYADPAHPTATPITHRIPRALVRTLRSRPASARRPDPAASPQDA